MFLSRISQATQNDFPSTSLSQPFIPNAFLPFLAIQMMRGQSLIQAWGDKEQMRVLVCKSVIPWRDRVLGPYTTSVTLIVISTPPLLYCCAHVVPILLLLFPIEAHYCYYCALTLLLLCWLWLYYDPLNSYI